MSRRAPPSSLGSIILLLSGRAEWYCQDSLSRQIAATLTIDLGVHREVCREPLDPSELVGVNNLLDLVGNRVESSPDGSADSLVTTRQRASTHSMRNLLVSLAVLMRSSSSARSSVKGFSHRTCLPANMASFEFLWWKLWGVPTYITSTS